MRELRSHLYSPVATWRNWSLPLQRLWPLPQDERHEQASRQITKDSQATHRRGDSMARGETKFLNWSCGKSKFYLSTFSLVHFFLLRTKLWQLLRNYSFGPFIFSGQTYCCLLSIELRACHRNGNTYVLLILPPSFHNSTRKERWLTDCVRMGNLGFPHFLRTSKNRFFNYQPQPKYS